jgi:hypothetical protein
MPPPEFSKNHVWVAAATVQLDTRQAKRAILRQSVRLPAQRRIDVLEVYCEQCRRPWDDVYGEPCIAAETNEHLRGGPIGVRAKRKHDLHRCDLLGCDVEKSAQINGLDLRAEDVSRLSP